MTGNDGHGTGNRAQEGDHGLRKSDLQLVGVDGSGALDALGANDDLGRELL